MNTDEMAQALLDGHRSGFGTVLVVPNGKPVLSCRGELLSNCQTGGYNVRFTAKQCKKMFEYLMSELAGHKIKLVDAAAQSPETTND